MLRLMRAVTDSLQIQWVLDPRVDMEATYNDVIEHHFGGEEPSER